MTTLSIFFINKNSQPGQYQDYAFFSDRPKLAPNPTGAPIYSNVFKSTTLTRDGRWSIGMTNSYYAWCGTADKKLATGARVDCSMSRLIALGNDAGPGSTLQMVNRAGRPAFASETALTANAGSFAVETGNDFDSDSSFVMGYGTVDEEGRLKPLVTVDAPANATVNIVPSTRCYISAHRPGVGTAIDATVASQHAATIDFTENPGMFGAIITHETNGEFSVKYASQTDFTRAVEIASEPSAPSSATESSAVSSTKVDPRDIELAQLRQQVQQMQIQLYAALNGNAKSTPPVPSTVSSAPISTIVPPLAPTTTVTTTKDPYPTKSQAIWYKATLAFRNAPGQSRRRDIRDRLTTHMQSCGYTYEGGSSDSDLVAMFSHDAGCYGAWHSLRRATSDWSDANYALPRHLKQYVDSEGKVSPAQESRGLWRASRTSNVNSVNGTSRSVSNARHERGSSHSPTKASMNGANGSEHKRESSRGSAKVLTNGVKAVSGVNGVHTLAVNGANGIHHGRTTSSTTSRSSTPTKHLTNGITAEAVRPVSNGVNGGNGVGGKYDYPHGTEDPIMKAKKMRARQVLIDEGLEEYAGGWRVGGS